jgi:Protein of unknown function (DUF998)
MRVCRSAAAGEVIPAGQRGAPARPGAAPSGSGPAPSGSGPAPSGSGPAPSGSGPAPSGPLARWRRVTAWALAVAGLIAYNWWLLVPFKPGLMTSPNELFSNLEVNGQPYATAMQHADLLSGILLFAAFVLAGRTTIADGRRDWLAMLVFATGGAAGGLFPEVCADGISAVCRQQEWHFQLPASQYIHIVAGIVEFTGITVALFLAIRRTRGSQSRTARLYRRIGTGALICYPLLGLAYLVNRMGGVMEAVFFIGFTVMVMTWMAERLTHRAGLPLEGVALRPDEHCGERGVSRRRVAPSVAGRPRGMGNPRSHHLGGA